MHPIQLRLRRTTGRGLAKPTVAQAIQTVGLAARALPVKVPTGDAQQLTSFLGSQAILLVTIQRIVETRYIRLP
jgi:hypothetical protein